MFIIKTPSPNNQKKHVKSSRILLLTCFVIISFNFSSFLITNNFLWSYKELSKSMPTEILLFTVQMKTRDTPCQMYSGAISTIPKATTLVTSQPTLHSTRIKIDGTTIFRLDISIHFKTVIRVWPHQVNVSFVIPPSYNFNMCVFI